MNTKGYFFRLKYLFLPLLLILGLGSNAQVPMSAPTGLQGHDRVVAAKETKKTRKSTKKKDGTKKAGKKPKKSPKKKSESVSKKKKKKPAKKSAKPTKRKAATKKTTDKKSKKTVKKKATKPARGSKKIKPNRPEDTDDAYGADDEYQRTRVTPKKRARHVPGQDPVIGTLPDGRPIYEGPRGGKYYKNNNDDKIYLPHSN